MSKNKLNYWQRRFLQIAVNRDKSDQTYIKEMEKRYDELSKSIRKEVTYWVKRYADNDKITESDARALLSKQEQKTWSMSLQEFQKKAIDGGYETELNREYFRSRISRLDQLQRQIYFELAEMANQEKGQMSAYLNEQLNESYLRNIYELTDRGSFSLPFDKYSAKALEIAINKPWLGSNFSARIWKNHLKTLPDKLTNVMSQAITQGWGINRTVNAMMEGVDKSLRNRMTTLVQTESAHLAEVASEKSMAETGVEKWEWLATLETHTCGLCASLDGQMFDVGDRDAPNCPAHPNCRCTKIPVIDGWISQARWSRDPITGKGKVGEHQSFEKWKKSYAHNDSVKQDFRGNSDDVKPIHDITWSKYIRGMNSKSEKSLNEVNARINEYGMKTGNEMLALVDNKSGEILSVQTGKNDQVVFNSKTISSLKNGTRGSLILSHNHPGSFNSVFSKADIDKIFQYESLQTLTLQTAKGDQFVLDRNGKYPSRLSRLRFASKYDRFIDKYIEKYGKKEELWDIITEEAVAEFAEYYGFDFRRVNDV